MLGELAGDDPELWVLALGAADRLGILGPEQLCRALGDDDRRVQRRAAELSARVRPADGSVVARLLELGEPPATGGDGPDHDGDITPGMVQEMCYFALGELEPAGPEVVDVLERAAGHHPDHLCREAAVAALGALGAGRATILAALDDRATVRRRAVLGLVNFDGPDIEAALRRALNDRDWQVRQAAEDLLAPD